MNQVLNVDRQAAVATVTLNRPSSLNALDSDMSYQLRDVFRDLSGDNGVRAVILQGAGDHFMAGGDIAYFQQSLDLEPDERQAAVNRLIGVVHEFISIMRSMPQPVIASVRGNAAGFGMSLVAASDLAIAAESARFTQAYCQIGTSPDGGNTFFLPRAIGVKRTMAMTLLNEPLDAAQALATGLVNRVVPDDELETVVSELARRLSHGPTRAYANVKKLLNSTMSNTLQQQLDAEQESFSSCSTSHDFSEGVTAFMEKRKAEFNGE
ncbi:MAG: enoyl-CoA hydratase [Sedimenticola sp.]|nr:enoyl-CoA hydratase [Sedimenticola sp.]